MPSLADDRQLYLDTSYQLAQQLTLRYSSSFGVGSRFLSAAIRPHIYAIYGLVRIADEIVDTYQGSDSAALLDELEHDTERAIQTGYGANPIVQAYADTARKYHIDPTEQQAFFASMRMDLQPRRYDSEQYRVYIHGSAEAVGLMCLSVFVGGDQTAYDRLKPGASALGAAYQKVNFLRDLAADYSERQRMYFPELTYDSFDESAKQTVVEDIRRDFDTARGYINQLPPACRRAVRLTYVLYRHLLDRLAVTPVTTIKQQRVRLSTPTKLGLIVVALLQGRA